VVRGLFFVLGLALAVWARVYLGGNWGMPMSQRADPELVTTGPYGRIRHPIYSGIILGMAGTAIAVSPYWLIAVAITGAYFLFSAVVEERTMARLFPAAYPPYRRATKMLIPYIF
jgi:protein-S-isoprenylcysteine O-methyltransferase Ste14